MIKLDKFHVVIILVCLILDILVCSSLSLSQTRSLRPCRSLTPSQHYEQRSWLKGYHCIQIKYAARLFSVNMVSQEVDRSLSDDSKATLRSKDIAVPTLKDVKFRINQIVDPSRIAAIKVIVHFELLTISCLYEGRRLNDGIRCLYSV